MRSSGYWLETVGFAFHRKSVWKTDLYSCAGMFGSAMSENVEFRITFSKGRVSRHCHPMTRKSLYRGEPAP